MKMSFETTQQVLQDAVLQGQVPGAVGGVWTSREPGRIWLCARGKRRLVPSEQDLDAHTVFDLASLTKLFTSVLCARVVERGWLDWDTPVRAVLPSFQDHTEHPVLLRHLLAHSAGFVDWRPFWQALLARAGGSPETLASVSVHARQKWMREEVWAVKPDVLPGAQMVYSDLSFLNLGFVLEEVLGRTLDRAMREFVLDPLELVDTGYRRVTQGVAVGRDEAVAATENCTWRGGVVQGQAHDDNTWAMGGYAGHAGLFGTARDLLLFAGRLLEGQFLAPKILKALWSRVDEPLGSSRTLGWDTPSGAEPSAGALFSRNSVGHLGFTGVSLWVDLDASVAAVLLTNRVHPSRENQAIRELRPRFHQALRNDLGF